MSAADDVRKKALDAVRDQLAGTADRLRNELAEWEADLRLGRFGLAGSMSDLAGKYIVACDGMAILLEQRAEGVAMIPVKVKTDLTGISLMTRAHALRVVKKRPEYTAIHVVDYPEWRIAGIKHTLKIVEAV